MRATATESVINTIRPLFFWSGLAALVYQVCWQRLLFAAFGVDIDSITIIVSAFMLGLGIGALAGGDLADRYPQRAIDFFAVSEFCIGAFGLASPWLIQWAGNAFVTASPPVVASVNFVLILIPATLMGATLPVLATYVTRHWNNVGKSIGTLYVFNTFGAALGTAVIGFIWFFAFELNTAIYTAACINLGISAIVWLRLREPSHA